MIFNPQTKRCIKDTSTNRIRIAKQTKHVFCEKKCKQNLLLAQTLDQGDCQFDSVLQILHSMSEFSWSINTLRQICARAIRTDYDDESLLVIRLAHAEDRITEDWIQNVSTNMSLAEYRDVVSFAMLTNDFWGDQYTLNMMSTELGIKFLTLDQDCNIVHETPDVVGVDSVALLYLEDLHYSPLYKSTHDEKRQFIFDRHDECIQAFYRHNWSQ